MLWVLICVHFVGETMRKSGWTRAHREWKWQKKAWINERMFCETSQESNASDACCSKKRSEMCKKFENRFCHGRYIRYTGRSWTQNRMNRVQISLQYYTTKICWKKTHPHRISVCFNISVASKKCETKKMYKSGNFFCAGQNAKAHQTATLPMFDII